MSPRFPSESPAHRAARGRLRTLEIEARRAIEDAAVARRALPPGGVVPEDYAFEELANGEERRVTLSSLFGMASGYRTRSSRCSTSRPSAAEASTRSFVTDLS